MLSDYVYIRQALYNSKQQPEKMSELGPLIQKLSSPIPQIQSRSLTNLYMKVTNRLVSQQQLLEFPELPGLLMSWINDNKKKSDVLLKVILILQEFTKFDKGKILLRRYQCLQFCEQFRMYMIQSDRGVEMFVEGLDEIIRRLLPLGRTDQSSPHNNPPTKQQHKQQHQPIQASKTPPPTKAQSESLKLICPHFPLDQEQEKIIFDQLMKLKYAHKDSIYTTLASIRVFVSQHYLNTYRCKPDLVAHLCELSTANVFPELSIQIISILLHGIFEANRWIRQGHLSKKVNLTYAKMSHIQQVEVQIVLPYKLYSVQASFIIINQLIRYYGVGEGATSLQYLIEIYYPYSIQYFLRILHLAKEHEVISNQNACVAMIQKYSQSCPERASSLIQALPQQIWRKTTILQQFADNQQKTRSFNRIKPYLDDGFELTKNLHIMREIIDNLKAGVKGIELFPKQCAKLYLEVLATLTISLSKQDPIMSYYNEAQNLFIQVLKINNEQLVSLFYQSILQNLINTKSLINYPGLVVAKHEVVEVLFSAGEFVMNVVRNSLDYESTLSIMLDIMGIFAAKDKFKSFHHYVPIIFGLCWHPSEDISAQANKLINKIKKNYTVYCIACNLFSSNAENRRKLLADLSSRPELQMDTIQKLSQGYFVNKKKPLKISKSSIENYFNIILNPSLQVSIKEEAINQFIDCIQRIQEFREDNKDKQSQFGDLTEARLCMADQIKRFNKKEKFDGFQQKLIALHLLLSRKVSGYGKQGFGLEIIIGFLARINSLAMKAVVLSTIYILVFQSPFTQQLYTKNFAMMYFPHLQVVRMKVEHPIHQKQVQQTQNKHNQGQSRPKIKQKQSTTFSLVLQLIPTEAQLSPQIKQSLEEQTITAITTTNIPKISQLSFLCHFKPKISFNKSTTKIMSQYIRTNSIAIDLADDLIRIFNRRQEDIGECYAGNGLVINLGLMKGRIIGNEQLEKLMRDVEDASSKLRLFKFLIQQSSVKFGSLNDYNNLKLIQSIISELRSSSSSLNSRILSLTLLYKLSTSQFNFTDNMATLLTLLYTILYEQQPTITQFSLALSCYSQLLTHAQPELAYNKMTFSIFEQICALVGKCFKQDQEGLQKNKRKYSRKQVIYSGCLGFLNDLMRLEIMNETGREYFNAIFNQSQNMVLISTGLLPKQFTQGCEEQLTMVTEIFIFLFLFTYNSADTISTLLNSTDILSVFLALITSVSAETKMPIYKKVEFFQVIGRFVYNLASKTDEFVFKMNRILRNQSPGKAQQKLHFTLMAPVPILAERYQAKQKKMYDHSYLKMVSWILFIWKQQSNILQEEDFIQPLVSCALQLRQVQLLAPLLTKSNTAQKLVACSSQISQKFKNWIKIVQELIFEKTKNSKKINQSKLEYPELRNKIMQGLVFATTIFSVTNNSVLADEPHPAYKQTVMSCVRFIDHVNTLLQLTDDQGLTKMWLKLVSNLFHNDLCSRVVCGIVNEGIFETVNKLVLRIQKSVDNIMEVSEQLSLLGSISCNESIRSLIVKNRIIQSLGKSLIAMDQNKVAKVNYNLVYCVSSFLCYLSQFKDTNAKIQNEKKLIDVWAKILSLNQSAAVEEKILQLLINLSAFKHSKSVFMSSREIHKVCLGLLAEPDYEQKQKILCIVYNILYKNAAGIKLYKNKQISQLIHNLGEVPELSEISAAVLEVLNSSQ